MLYSYTTSIISLKPPIAQKDLDSALAVARRQFHFKCLFVLAYNFPTTLPF